MPGCVLLWRRQTRGRTRCWARGRLIRRSGRIASVCAQSALTQARAPLREKERESMHTVVSESSSALQPVFQVVFRPPRRLTLLFGELVHPVHCVCARSPSALARLRQLLLAHRSAPTFARHNPLTNMAQQQPQTAEEPLAKLYVDLMSQPSRACVIFVAAHGLRDAVELRPVRIDRAGTRAPEYLAINPLGKVPFLVRFFLCVWCHVCARGRCAAPTRPSSPHTRTNKKTQNKNKGRRRRARARERGDHQLPGRQAR